MQSHAPTLTGRKVFFIFAAFFGITALVNAYMVTEALKTHSGLATDHPYEKGLAYNQVVQAEEAQEHLQWKSDISYTHGVLKVTLTDKHGAALKPSSLHARFYRPSTAGMDFERDLKPEGDAITFPAPGLWEVRIFATVGDHSFQHAKRLTIEE